MEGRDRDEPLKNVTERMRVESQHAGNIESGTWREGRMCAQEYGLRETEKKGKEIKRKIQREREREREKRKRQAEERRTRAA